jgi:magnesium/cobalt transport protein CorA
MEIYHFVTGQPSVRHDALEEMPKDGLVWIDFLRSESTGWEQLPRKLLGIEVDFQHVLDSQNANHPSSFDRSDAYDVLTFEGLGPIERPLPMETRVAAFFLFDRLLITVRAAGNLSFEETKRQLAFARVKTRLSVVGLTHQILDTMVDRFLAIREPLDRHLTQLQDDLLDADTSMSDWTKLLVGRREVRRLEALSEAQLEALDAWRRGSCFDWTTGEQVRVRDLVEHVTRVRNHAADLERDLEAAVQLYFAVTSHRANEIMKIFTVMSVVFMPLTLLTGIWGMNFQDMPELHWRYGYPVALTLIVFLGVAMFLWFKRRKFF